MDNRVPLFVASLFIFVAGLLMGPSQVLGFPDKIWIACLGQLILGFGMSGSLIPSLPEMIRQGKEKYPRQQEKVSDLAAGVFNSLLGFGQILGPLYGANMMESTSFRYTCDFVALVGLLNAISLLVFGNAWEGF